MSDSMMRLSAVNDICSDVREFVLVPADPSSVLRPYVPGSHIAIHTRERANTYSLTDDGYLPDAYRISVRRQGREGGSAWLHNEVQVGDHLTVSLPRSAFAPVLSARNHLLIAAGIGITPILSHLKAARRWNRSFEVIYGYSSMRAPHLDDLLNLGGAKVTAVEGRIALELALRDAIVRQPIGTHAYACGPGPFLDGFVSTSISLGWPEERLHIEHFDAPELDAGLPFTVRLPARDMSIDVPSGASLLESLDAVNITLPRLCRRGVCGQCRVNVLSGVPEHRDLILTRAERERNDTMFACVSRADPASSVLELDL